MLREELLSELTERDYYNLDHEDYTKHAGYNLLKQEEMKEILKFFEDRGFHTVARFQYLLDNNSKPTETKVMQDLFFISPDQVYLARSFVSGFLYETNATFNTNKLRLPLSIMVGITNTGKTFPMAMCYITSESYESFEFVQH
jgi:hypothetical protein